MNYPTVAPTPTFPRRKILSSISHVESNGATKYSRASSRNGLKTASAHSDNSMPMLSDTNQEPWTLKVSKLDIMKLRNEIDDETVREKVTKFEETFLAAQ